MARGQVTTVSDETATGKWVVYDDESDYDREDLEDWVDANDASDMTFDDVDDLSITQEGRAGVVEGTMDLSEL